MLWSDAVHVCFAPAAAYADLSTRDESPGSLELPLLFSLLLGVVVAVANSGRASFRLVLGCAIAWSFVPALQISSVAATWLVFAHRRLPFRRALHLHFLGHLPWSSWLLAIAAIASATPPAHEWDLWRLVYWTAPVPLVWSRWIGWQFFRRVFGAGRRGAVVATSIHLAIVLGLVFVFFVASDQLGPRLRGSG